MPMRREDKELSKYSKYKARVDFNENRTSSEHARWGSVGGTALARVSSHVPVVGFACVFGRCESRVVTVVTTGDPEILTSV